MVWALASQGSCLQRTGESKIPKYKGDSLFSTLLIGWARGLWRHTSLARTQPPHNHTIQPNRHHREVATATSRLVKAQVVHRRHGQAHGHHPCRSTLPLAFTHRTAGLLPRPRLGGSRTEAGVNPSETIKRARLYIPRSCSLGRTYNDRTLHSGPIGRFPHGFCMHQNLTKPKFTEIW